jgi:hypothetical protein
MSLQMPRECERCGVALDIALDNGPHLPELRR